MKRQWNMLILCCLCVVGLRANHIQVGQLTLTDIDPIKKIAVLQCQLRWQNSWRSDANPGNHDAAWVFFKFRRNNGDWQHLHPAPQGHSATATSPVSFQPESANPRESFHPTRNPIVGLLLYRATPGKGTLIFDTLRIQWHYGQEGIESATSLELRVFALEMVYVPEGPFQLGDGQSTGTFRGTGSNTPVSIGDFATVLKCEDTSNDDAQLEGAGIWIHGSAGISQTSSSPVQLNPHFPTGYRSFYVMKHEVSQQNYTDFLNTLTPVQASARAYTGGTFRHNIQLQSGIYTTSTPHLPHNWMNWEDAAAFADWAALRPMTENEFEKACRGNQTALGGEFAWGTTGITNNSYLLQAAGTIAESVSNSSSIAGNAVYDQTTTLGPFRSGIFAEPGSNNRVQAGASFWGIMELSGNLVELCITIGRAEGRVFTGRCGDGILDASGVANVADWPASSAIGIGFRGGSWLFGSNLCRVSDRQDAATDFTTRFEDIGFRAVR